MSFDTPSNSYTTAGITVTVKTDFIPAQSSHQNSLYSFAYQITIQNHSDFTVKLLRRKWVILDAYGDQRIVEGEGVVGQQPVIAPGETFTYQSGSQFKTPFGKMGGFYTMLRLLDSEAFEVKIPDFILENPAVLN
jgi:ApaG protein